ncbi:efflux RND transporter periplasmic adaptor subunit [Caballeronia sp. LZ035]|uniref:efflux RND transporter periplasmic adaptor subunit n=1 Tax=Caballeronia sp. LZ035 TaxID=3038568 RepID=UPI002861EE73|nr:efflux RND transporter periplasmic adaptor subunit [Caballeronia sp. LZ035]MDR5763249.1 efflux RND transporter periplasmic adaptor subunit [Caballeronia sp. LZ035]
MSAVILTFLEVDDNPNLDGRDPLETGNLSRRGGLQAPIWASIETIVSKGREVDELNQSEDNIEPFDTAIRPKRSRQLRLWLVPIAALAAGAAIWLIVSMGETNASAASAPPPPKVAVSKPLVKELDAQLSFLGQFSAVNQVELRAQVGGTLTGIQFKDGEVVHKGDLLYTIDPIPYEIRLSQAKARLETANAKLVLSNQELARAQDLQRSAAGTVQSVEQRFADRQTAIAAADDAKAQIRDAQFDLDHCRIFAPFTGRIGSHQVSVGNLIAGSRAATSPTTLLATLVSLDPIYMNFDMSEADYQAFSRYRAEQSGPLANKVALALAGSADYSKHGTLDFVDNVIDRASGTIHARATVSNADFSQTPGEFARVRVAVTQRRPTLLVPDASVQADQSEHVVMTVSAEGTVVPKKVAVGEIRGGLREVRSGLSPSDDVIIDGIPYAAPGGKVEKQVGTIHYVANQE